MSPNPQQIIDLFDQLRKLTPSELNAAETAMLNALMRDSNGPPPAADGFPSGTMGGGGGGDSTSVETAALTDRPLRDEHHENFVNAFSFLQQAVQSWGAMKHRLELVSKRSVPDVPTSHKAPVCAERHCEDDAVKAGRCQPCYLWRYRWAQGHGRPISEAPPVPAGVIEARVLEREKRRVHVTGPYAEMEAS